MALVELQGVSKRYRKVEAVADVSLTIAAGEFVTLLGPSGSGKTTLLNLVAGTTSPSSGAILINGRDAAEIPSGKRGFGMVFQNYALMPHMTVFENIAFPLRVRRVPRAAIHEKVEAVLELIRLPDVADRKPRALSGGQQQRVSLARCIVYNPSLILMDEPLGALDKKLREQMQLEIKRLHTELGITILYVTHDQEEALTLSDRIVLMNEGRVEQVAAADDLYFHPRSVFAAAFLGESNLLPAEVRDVDKVVTVWSAYGAMQASVPYFPISAGQAVTVLVRPENLSVLQDDQDMTACNRVEAVILHSIVLGGIVKHYLRLRDGRNVVVVELNRAGRSQLSSGSAVLLVWRPEDTLLLPAACSLAARSGPNCSPAG